MNALFVSNTKRYALLLCALLFAVIIAGAQQVRLSGTVKNHAGKPVQEISIMLKNNSGEVIAYDYSNKEGKYTLFFSDTLQRSVLLIEVNWLGYKKIQKQLQNEVLTYDLVVEESVIELKEVTVKTKAIIKSGGDTLSYDVNSFARKEDRSIGDVMKHLPGITVDNDGRISFNGKQISNLYIHDDDLMDGRYGLATKVITKEMIKSIDVIQNHQPIRVLQHKIYSDDVAINLVLKDENSLKLSGQAIAGAGLPHQYDVELNGMVFNKRFKTLNSIKSNNTGTDYRSDLQQFNLQHLLNSVENTRPEALLSEGIAGDPDIPRKNYYLNRSVVFNLNTLYNTRDTLQIRSNIQLFFDRNTFDYNSRADYYLPDDTIHYNTTQYALRKPFVLNTSLTARMNKAKYYLNENFLFNFSGYDNRSELQFNGNAFSQRLFARTYDVSNDLEFTPAVSNNNIINVRWYMNFYNSPQKLYIGSGIDSTILNGGSAYTAVGQDVQIPSFINNMSAYYAITNKKLIKKNYQLGMVNEWQQLNSSILLTQLNNSNFYYTGDAGNALLWRRNKIFATANYSAEQEFWRVDLSLPVSLNQVSFKQAAYGLDEEKKYLFINPNINLKWYTNPQDYLSLGYQYRNSMGNISGVYRGAVLTNYLSLSANDAALQEKRSSSISLHYNYQRSLIPLFMDAGLSYNTVTANSILSSILTNNIQRTVLLPYENNQSSISANMGMSKYIFPIMATVSLNGSWRTSRYSQLVNTQLFPYYNDNFSLSFGIQSKPIDNVSFNYSGSGSWNRSRPGAGKGTAAIVNRVKRFDQQLLLGYSPKGGLFVNVTGRHIYGVQSGMDNINYLFLDANIRYKIAHWDIEFALTNLFNIQEYKTAMLTSNQFIFSNYKIRGRMGVVRATFHL
jgi:hypothetical protein